MEMNRRAFVGTSVAAGILAASVAALASADEPSENLDAQASEEPSEAAPEADDEMTCDVVVVGAGISGMGCALEAAELGLDVVLLEKEGFLGGTMMGTEGIFGLESQQQLDAGIELPNKYQIVQKELEYTNYRTDPLLWGDVIDAAGEDIDWLVSHGAEFQSIDNYLGQSDYSTFHWWLGESGATAAGPLGERLSSVARVMLSTAATDLVIEDGVVCGVIARSEDGSVVRIKAGSVVLAAGGMANDLVLLGEKMGMDLSQSASLFPIRCVGDALRMAVSAGAQETPVSMMNVFGVRGYEPTAPVAVAGTLQPTLLFVNGGAERFMAEDLYIKKFFALVTNAWSAQDVVYSIFTQAQVDQWENEGCICGVAAVKAGDKLEGLKEQLEEASASGTAGVWMGETLVELAEAIGIDADELESTVGRYNEMVASGDDVDYGKSSEYLEAFETGPFYAVNPVYSVFATMGGILIDRSTRVINEAGDVIPGLYSTGSASCGLYKETYCYQVSGGMNAYCLYTGRKAARVIAEQVDEARGSEI